MTSILFLAADPTDASRLRLGEEIREIQEKLRLSRLPDPFAVHQRMSVRPSDISQALLDVNPQIVHVSGHGTSAGALCVEDLAGRVHPIQPEALAALFAHFADQVRCVLLNACYSLAQAEAIARHIPFVIGMSQEISDEAGIAFAVGFYQALGAGRSIEDAYELGCVQIMLENIPEHLTPVLLKGTPRDEAQVAISTEDAPPKEPAITPPVVAQPTNLSFDGPVIQGLPWGWFNSLGFVDYVSTAYEISVLQCPGGKGGMCLRFQHPEARPDEFGSLMQRCPAPQLAAATIRFEGEVRTRNVRQWAGLWLRADGHRRFNLFHYNMSDRPIRGTTDWTTYTIDTQLPRETTWLNYGLVLAGRGTVWVDRFRLLLWREREWLEV
jgi:hypothetical protein